MTGKGCLVKRFGWNQRIALKEHGAVTKIGKKLFFGGLETDVGRNIAQRWQHRMEQFSIGLRVCLETLTLISMISWHHKTPYMLYAGYTPDFQISEIPCPADAMSRSPASQLTQQVRCLPTCQVSKPGSQISQVPRSWKIEMAPVRSHHRAFCSRCGNWNFLRFFNLAGHNCNYM